MTITVTDIQLEKIFRRAYELGEKNGAEKVLMEYGVVSTHVKKNVAIKKIGLGTYRLAVERGYLHPRKLNPTKKNSTIVVDRLELNYIENEMTYLKFHQ